MTPDEVRACWSAFRREVDVETRVSKDSQAALFRQFDMYESLSAVDRLAIDGVIAEQVLSADETDRFDAVALIDEFAITSAVPALRRLVARSEEETRPGAPIEWAKVNRVVGRLTDAAP